MSGRFALLCLGHSCSMQVQFTPERRARIAAYFASRDGRVALAAIATAWMLFGLAIGTPLGTAFIALGVLTGVACVANERIFGVAERDEPKRG